MFMIKWMKRGLLILGITVGLGLLYWAMADKPIPVDTVEIERGPMVKTISEEGVTRIRDTYTISATIAGHIDRIDINEGDKVDANQTAVAVIHPLDVSLIDNRTQSELLALVDAAAAAVTLANVGKDQAETAENLAESAYRRARKLADSDLVSARELEELYSDLQLKHAQLESSNANIQLRQAELAAVKAQLLQPGEATLSTSSDDCCVSLFSPVDGIVLDVYTTSEQVVAAGTPLLEVGEPSNLEITLDLLSQDAVIIEQGTAVTVTDWGGDKILNATVSRIEPAAFTKVSSLGISEQRVKVELTLEEVPDRLGHGYHVLANLVVWESDDVVKLPIGALFRSAGNWSVFVVRDGRAELRSVSVGHINDQYAEVIEGVKEGDKIVLYPSDRVLDSVLVEARKFSEG